VPTLGLFLSKGPGRAVENFFNKIKAGPFFLFKSSGTILKTLDENTVLVVEKQNLQHIQSRNEIDSLILLSTLSDLQNSKEA